MSEPPRFCGSNAHWRGRVRRSSSGSDVENITNGDARPTTCLLKRGFGDEPAAGAIRVTATLSPDHRRRTSGSAGDPLDVVEVEAPGIGVLSNKVAAESV